MIQKIEFYCLILFALFLNKENKTTAASAAASAAAKKSLKL